MLAIEKDLHSLQNPSKAKILQRFFKTGKGHYGEGDLFLGITVPQQRILAKRYLHLTLKDLEHLLQNNIHEYRLTALLILVDQYKKADANRKKEIVTFYLNNTPRINNWDLVDASAHQILGNYLLDKDRTLLYTLVKSSLLWERRIAIVSTYAFIKKNQFEDTFKIVELLKNDTHDLIHKATGWMLRELGKKDQKALETFLDKHCTSLPRTCLRYSIERFDENKRKYYLNQ